MATPTWTFSIPASRSDARPIAEALLFDRFESEVSIWTDDQHVWLVVPEDCPTSDEDLAQWLDGYRAAGAHGQVVRGSPPAGALRVQARGPADAARGVGSYMSTREFESKLRAMVPADAEVEYRETGPTLTISIWGTVPEADRERLERWLRSLPFPRPATVASFPARRSQPLSEIGSAATNAAARSLELWEDSRELICLGRRDMRPVFSDASELVCPDGAWVLIDPLLGSVSLAGLLLVFSGVYIVSPRTAVDPWYLNLGVEAADLEALLASGRVRLVNAHHDHECAPGPQSVAAETNALIPHGLLAGASLSAWCVREPLLGLGSFASERAEVARYLTGDPSPLGRAARAQLANFWLRGPTDFAMDATVAWHRHGVGALVADMGVAGDGFLARYLGSLVHFAAGLGVSLHVPEKYAPATSMLGRILQLEANQVRQPELALDLIFDGILLPTQLSPTEVARRVDAVHTVSIRTVLQALTNGDAVRPEDTERAVAEFNESVRAWEGRRPAKMSQLGRLSAASAIGVAFAQDVMATIPLSTATAVLQLLVAEGAGLLPAVVVDRLEAAASWEPSSRVTVARIRRDVRQR